jgi:hypothetical protein
MRAAQQLYQNLTFSNPEGDNLTGKGTILILGFGEKEILKKEQVYAQLRRKYPVGDILLCSTSGEIYKDQVLDGSVSILIMEFEKTEIIPHSVDISSFKGSFEAGQFLFKELNREDLSYLMVISDGSLVNGSELVRGLEYHNSKKVLITGGLAGDAANFTSTLVGCNEEPTTGKIIGIGFYGSSLSLGYGSYGGFEIFGTEKRVTKSKSNRLYEIDNQSALDLYKQYLGAYANDLPASALHFPLNVRLEGVKNSLVRTILSIDPDDHCMVFAGDVPEGSYVRFMKSNFDKIINGASIAASNCLISESLKKPNPKIALLISCVGRKIILDHRVEEENEAVMDVFGNKTLISGFYSYGEISPVDHFTPSQLNNQTMTITTLDEDLA